ncbi:uncharacterized protein LOC111714864, partial [Eurytemora carolleeae]|uniref:uncharacterized protein LOC111714864 n=1 Tax=Eurytemora carolleeae TaxID=1294199 RepID=UPI000C7652A7
DLRQFDRKTRGSSNGKLVLFSHPEDRDRCIKNLIRIFDVEDVYDLPFKVYSLSELVLHIVKIENVSSTYTKEQLSEKLLPLRRPYESGLGCEWHEANTDYGLCSTGVLRRWILSVCEIMKPVKPSACNQGDEDEDDGFWSQKGSKTELHGNGKRAFTSLQATGLMSEYITDWKHYTHYSQSFEKPEEPPLDYR